jgi:hypothetical protein
LFSHAFQGYLIEVLATSGLTGCGATMGRYAHPGR